MTPSGHRPGRNPPRSEWLVQPVLRGAPEPEGSSAMPRLAMTRTRATLLALGVTLVGGLFSLAPGPVTASSHREAPLISGQPQYDNTDVYAFVSPDRPDTT